MALAALAVGAGDEDVGLEKDVVFLLAQLHVRDENFAGTATEVVAQCQKHVACNSDMCLRGTCHHTHSTVVVLVLVGLICFPGELGLGTEKRLVSG